MDEDKNDDSKPKVIVMALPLESKALHDGNIPEGHPRGALALRTMNMGSQLLKEHPEVSMAAICLYTPRPQGVTGKFDESHTCIVSGDHPNTVEDLRKFLNRAIPALISLRMKVETDPLALSEMLKPHKPEVK